MGKKRARGSSTRKPRALDRRNLIRLDIELESINRTCSCPPWSEHLAECLQSASSSRGNSRGVAVLTASTQRGNALGPVHRPQRTTLVELSPTSEADQPPSDWSEPNSNPDSPPTEELSPTVIFEKPVSPLLDTNSQRALTLNPIYVGEKAASVTCCNLADSATAAESTGNLKLLTYEDNRHRLSAVKVSKKEKNAERFFDDECIATNLASGRVTGVAAKSCPESEHKRTKHDFKCKSRERSRRRTGRASTESAEDGDIEQDWLPKRFCCGSQKSTEQTRPPKRFCCGGQRFSAASPVTTVELTSRKRSEEDRRPREGVGSTTSRCSKTRHS